MSQEIRIFKPKLIEERPLPLGSEELSYAPKLLQASQNGMIKVRLEEDVIIQRVSRDLYAKPDSGFREFYNNEARACRIASKLYGANPQIEITLMPSERKLVIEGVDSLGISQEKFLQVYSVLGRSDNFEGSEVGMFGLGRAAYTTLTEVMVLETFSREDGTKYAVLGKNGVGYNLLPEPKMNQYGTRVTFVLYGKIDIQSLIERVVKCARFSGVESFLNLEEDLPERGYWREEAPDKKGRYRLGPNSFEKYLEEGVKRDKYNYKELVRYVPVEIADEDFHLYAGFVVKRSYEGPEVRSSGSESKEVYLLGTPIQAEIDLPFSAWILNIHDERKYPPTADRERLADQSAKAIQQRVESRLQEAVEFLSVSSVDGFLSSEYREILEGYESLGLEKHLSKETLEMCRFANINVKLYGQKETKKVAEALRKHGKSLFYLPTLNRDKVSLLESSVPGAVVLRLAKNEGASVEELMELLSEHGVRNADEFIRENKLKPKPQEWPLGELAVHVAGTGYYSWGRYQTVRRHVMRTSPDTLSDTTIRVPKRKMLGHLGLLSTAKTDYRIVMDDRRLAKGTQLKDFIESLTDKRVVTNHGEMSFQDLVGLEKPPVIVLYSDPGIAKHYSQREETMVFGNADLFFELASYLVYHERRYGIDISGHEEFDKLCDEGKKDDGNKLWISHFIDDGSYEKLGDSEILYSVIQAMREVKDEQLRDLFLNASRWSKNAEEVASMRRYVLSLNAILHRLPEARTVEDKGTS